MSLIIESQLKMNLEDIFGNIRGIPSTNLRQGLDSLQNRLKKISILFEQVNVKLK